MENIKRFVKCRKSRTGKNSPLELPEFPDNGAGLYSPCTNEECENEISP
jgi:hypothetical protein